MNAAAQIPLLTPPTEPLPSVPRILVGFARYAPDVNGAPGEWGPWEANWLHNGTAEVEEGVEEPEPPLSKKHPEWSQTAYRFFYPKGDE